MDVHDLRPETRAALAAVQAAQALVRARTGAADVRLKGPGDVVTATDIAAQDAIEAVLAAAHPTIAFVGEEGRLAVPETGPYWLVDPLCGTANYAAGLPLVASNVALVEAGEVTVAAVGDGSSGEAWVAERGRGGFRVAAGGALERLAVSERSGLINLDLLAYGPGRLATFGAAFARQVLEHRPRAWDLRALSTSLVLAHVASGRLAATVYASAGPPLVHYAAGLLLAAESGALVTGEAGAPWRLDERVFVVAAGVDLHRALLGLAQAAIAELDPPSLPA
jgi:myo-inositol-1(or 4)-monophosphatase